MPAVDQQTGIEAAPTLIYPDGDGGVTYHPIDDDTILKVATSIAERENWTEEERDGLYEAVVNLIAELGEA